MTDEKLNEANNLSKQIIKLKDDIGKMESWPNRAKGDLVVDGLFKIDNISFDMMDDLRSVLLASLKKELSIAEAKFNSL